jgi:flagellar biogenesis protein FliO
MRVLICLLVACLACAQDAAKPSTPPPTPAKTAPTELFSDQEWNATQTGAPAVGDAPRPGWGSAGTMLVGLMVVVGVAVGLGWAVKRLNARRLLGGRGRHLEVLETVTIAPRRSLVLVRCGTTWLVVGLGEREMISVATLPAPPGESTATGATAPAPQPAPASPFASELSRLLSRPSEPRP